MCVAGDGCVWVPVSLCVCVCVSLCEEAEARHQDALGAGARRPRGPNPCPPLTHRLTIRVTGILTPTTTNPLTVPTPQLDSPRFGTP